MSKVVRLEALDCRMSRIPSCLKPVVGLCFGIAILASALFGVYFITLFLPVLLLGYHRTWRAIMDRAISFWMIVPMTLLEYVFGMRTKVTGDSIDCEKPALVIMNHRTRLDWMYFWSAVFKINPWLICTSKITLKKQLRKLPGAGFGMAANHFIFLERHIEEDKQRLSEAIDYYIGMGRNYQILLFPEGTDKSPWTTEKSKEYASKNNLKQLNHVIYPRCAGIAHLINKMRQHNYISCVYDVTVGYPANTVQSEVDLVLRGQCPEKVDFDIRRIDMADVPHDENQIGEWINQLWVEKDQKLSRYYSLPSQERDFCYEGGRFLWEEADEPMHSIAKLFSLGFWAVVIGTYLFHVTFLQFSQLVTLYSICAVLVINCAYGGIEHMVLCRWKNSRLRNKAAGSL